MADYNEKHLTSIKALKDIASKLQDQISQDESNLSNYLQKSEAETTYAKITDVEKKADQSALADYLTKTDAQDEYAKKTDIASAYKVKGSVADLAGLEGLNVADNVGNVYNVKAAFTTDDTFLEGTGKSYPAGTNVVVVDDEETYKFDALAGITDLSAYETAAQAGAKYATKEEIADVVTDESIVEKLAPYAKSAEVAETYETKANVTSGLAAKADKTEIADMLTKTEAGTTYIPQSEIATDEEITALITELFPA